jgi:hypothetical protein
VLTRVQFMLLFTPAERIAVRGSADPGIVDWFAILNDPQFEGVNLASKGCADALSYLVLRSILTAERKAAILKGEEP